MSDSTHPALPHKGNGGLIAVGVILLLGAGGALVWKSQSKKAEPELEEITQLAPVAKEPPAPRLANAPPPPPPEEEEEEKEKPKAQAGKTKAKGTPGCSGACNGKASAALRSALGARGAMARTCYNAALRRNPNLTGKMTMNVRISPTGSVCSASVSNNTLGDPSVASCAISKFRSSKFPAPSGGCVNTAVPLNFTKK